MSSDMKKYYICFEKHHEDETTKSFRKSWVIRLTDNDMDTAEGLEKEIKEMQEEHKCLFIWIINWKRLK